MSNGCNQPLIFKGENKCQSLLKTNNNQCENLAYFINPLDNRLLCGVHSRSIKNRIELKPNPNKKNIVEHHLRELELECEKIAEENRKLGKRGDVMCTKMKMMKNPPDVKGFMKVFPNFKHENRKDGYGCSSLSPKSIGPIHHKQPNLPIAKNLENFHQFNKVFSWEVDDNGNILPLFFTNQINAYNDPIPHRHKIPAQDIQTQKRLQKDSTNINVPLFSVHLTQDGTLKKFSYLESRYFYCHHYEVHVKLSKQFLHLQELLENGFNLQIVGYDAYSMNKIHSNETVIEMFQRFYYDVSKPFGHEMVLAAMLMICDQNMYPWNIFYQTHSDVYQGCF